MTLNISKAFYLSTLVSIVCVWLPTKIIGYFMPYVCLLIFLKIANVSKYNFRAFVFIIALTIFIFANAVLRENFLIHSGMLSIVTYGAIIVYIVLPTVDYYNIKYKCQTYYAIVEKVLLFQSIVGIIQLVLGVLLRHSTLDLDTGDVIQGTISPLSFLPDAAMGFGNQMFVINILMLVTFLIPAIVDSKITVFTIILGFATIILASVLHLTAAWLFALGLVFVFYNNIFNKYIIIIVLVVCINGIVVYYTQPSNFDLIERYFTEYLSGESLKIVATVQALVDMPKDYPLMHIIGVGPGQFSSKAGLIGTGQYFGEFYNPTEIPLLPKKISDAFLRYGYDLWAYTNKPDIVKWINSTMNRTFYSVLSIYTEFGGIVMLVALGYLSKLLFFLKKCYLNKKMSKNSKLVSFCTAVNIVFVVFISFFENYLESSQAIFTGLLLIKLCIGRLKHEDNLLKLISGNIKPC